MQVSAGRVDVVSHSLVPGRAVHTRQRLERELMLDTALDSDAPLDDRRPFRPTAQECNDGRLGKRRCEHDRVARLFGERDCGVGVRFGDTEPPRPPAHARPAQLDRRL